MTAETEAVRGLHNLGSWSPRWRLAGLGNRGGAGAQLFARDLLTRDLERGG